MSPFVKGALGFLGCAGLCGAAYAIGKAVGREETLKEIETEERCAAAEQRAQKAESATLVSPGDIPDQGPQEEETPVAQPETPAITPAERVRKMHGLKGKIFGTTSVIKDMLKNPDGKQMVVTVEDGDIVARITPK